MTPQEREVISGIFDRLKQGATGQRDPEAERYIADLVARQPYAPYVMAQQIYVQEQALANMQREMERLQSEAQQNKGQSGGFLSSLFGGGQPAQRPAAPWGGQAAAPQGYAQQSAPQQGGPQQGYAPQAAPQQGGPWGGQPQRGGSGFLGTALTTAAGVAGGMVAGNMLMNAFSGHGGGGMLGGGGSLANADTGSIWGGGGSSVQNASDYDTGGLDTGSEPEVQNASYDDSADYDTGGLDSGGGRQQLDLTKPLKGRAHCPALFYSVTSR